VAKPIKVKASGSRCIVFGVEGFTVYGFGSSGAVEEAANVKALNRVHDGDACEDTVVLATGGGVEVYSVAGPPRLLARHQSDEPFQSVEVKKPYIYAGREGDGVTLLEFNEPGRLRKAGYRSWDYHELKALNDGERYVKLSDDGKTIMVYRERTLPPDFTKYKNKRDMDKGSTRPVKITGRAKIDACGRVSLDKRVKKENKRGGT
jgi:hypothetical protein